jgi:hypothetical protein
MSETDIGQRPAYASFAFAALAALAFFKFSTSFALAAAESLRFGALFFAGAAFFASAAFFWSAHRAF